MSAAHEESSPTFTAGRQTRRRHRAMKMLLALLATVLFLAQSAWAVEVDKLYAKKCALCHSLNGKGGKKADLGGALDGVGAKRDEAWLRAYMKDPKSKMPDAKMPKVKLSDEEFDAMIKFLLSQTAPPPAK
jgi:mono/diheme cytochrome c family protein